MQSGSWTPAVCWPALGPARSWRWAPAPTVRVLAVHLLWAGAVFGTVPLDAGQRAVCLGTASTVLLVELCVGSG
ncbi:hypothetical protein [Streptomyces sp. NPDC059010]|uniref:hypothetical protein n=1 Tax=Streptomyces sp. NPDC059010 TaxID=3346695 RepID=UPI00367FEAB6